jgi:serine/threonine-protein kinase
MASDVFGIVGTTQAGSFRVERVVAEGGFAVIYRAYHEGFRAPVALKCLKVPETMTEEGRAAFLEKFREEGALLFRLSASSPAIVRPLHVDVLELPGGRFVPFLALEWLEGEGFDVILQRRRDQGKPPLDLPRLVSFLQPAAAALAQAHRLPGPDGPIAVIHRDVKPDHIFNARVEGGEVVKILDFGIARAKSAATLHAGRTTMGAAVDAFTPGYASPEQWVPKRYGQTGPWTDVWGLALTMVEALVGRPAIDGDLPGMMGTALDEGRRPTPRTEGAVVSDAVERVFEQALAVDPRRRTQSIEAFWTGIEVALGLAPSLSVRPGTAPGSSRALASDPPPPMPGAPAPARPPRPPPDRMVAQTLPAAQAPAFTPPTRAPTPAVRAPTPPARPVTPPVRPADEIAHARTLPADPKLAEPKLELQIELAAPVRRREDIGGTLAPDVPETRTLADLRERLRTPAILVVLAMVVGGADAVYGHVVGEPLVLLSLRPVWVAGPLALLGVMLGCWRLLDAM